MRWLPTTLRARLILAVIAVEVVAIAWLVFSGVRLIADTASELNRQRLEELVPLLTRTLSRPLFEQDVATIEHMVSGITRQDGLTAVSVFDQAGRLLVETRALPPAAGADSAVEGEPLVAAVFLAGRHVGSVRLVVSTAAADEAKRAALAQILLIAGLEVIASILALSLLALVLTRDLARMRGAAHSVTQGDWTVRLPVTGSAEVAETAAAFNRMLGSLQESESLVREGEHQYRDLVQQSQQAILVLHGRQPVFANDACARLLGFGTPAAVLALEGIDALILTGPELHGVVRTDWQARPASREPFRMQVARPDGARLWLECVGSHVHWRGRPAYQLVMLDISARRQAEEALADSEARYREIVETSQEGIWLIDADARTTYANRRMAEILGYPEAELLGRPYFDFVEPRHTDAIQAALDRGRTGASDRSDGVLIRRGGQRVLVQASTTPRFDAQGRYLGALGMFTDISERKRAEEALREVERRLRTVVQHAPLVLYALDRNGVFLLSEGRELETLGRVPGEVVGRSALEVFAHLPERVACLRRALAGEAFTAQVQVDDQIFDAYHQPLLDEQGEVDGIIVVSVNSTARKLAEDALREAERQLSTVIDHTPVIVFILLPDGTVALARGKGLELVGLSPDEVAGRNALQIVGSEVDGPDNVRKALAGQAVVTRTQLAGRDLDLWMQPLFGADGALERVLGLALDVTERVDAERKLQASEGRFRAFAEASADWLWETDEEHRLTHLSESFTRIMGEGTAYYLGKRREELAADLNETEKWARYQELLAAHLPLRDFVYLRLTGDGRQGYLRINGIPVFEEAGQFRGYRGTATDVSEQMRMQGALAASEARFRNLVEGSLQGVLLLSGEWRPLFANRAVAAIFGYDGPEQLMAMPTTASLIHPEDRERLDGIRVARLRGEKPPTRYEYRGIRKDGAVIWLDSLTRLVEWDGAPAFQNTILDITEQKAAEDILRRNEAKFRNLIENSDLATFIFDEAWQLVFLNESAARLFGYPSRDLALAEIRDGRQLVFEEDRAVLEAYREARRTGQTAPPRYEFRAVRQDGNLLWLQNIVSMVEWEGQTASMSVSIDITEHKLREEVLRQAQKMEAVGQLTGGVAHDFNNLLTVVLGNLELLRRRCEPDPTLIELIRSCTRAAERGAMLTQRLLAFSRRQALVPESVEVNRLVSGMTDLLRRTLQEDIEIETVLAGGLWPALVDPNQLENTLLNLAINARDAMPAGGKLTIEAANSRLDDEYAKVHEEVRAGQYVMLAVSDTGAGMTEEVLGHAFEPFFTTKEVGQGSGLGLSMIYGFVKQSRGHVKIYSEPGQGTTVKVYLPRAPMPPGAQRLPISAETWQGAQQKILVVEDDDAVRELAVAILQNLNYRPLAAADGRSALEILARESDIALLFTDVVLAGGMGGIELAREVQRRRPDIKVLYTSGYTENAIIHHGRLDEGVELLEKPFRIDSLARKVRSVLGDS